MDKPVDAADIIKKQAAKIEQLTKSLEALGISAALAVDNLQMKKGFLAVCEWLAELYEENREKDERNQDKSEAPQVATGQ